MATNISIRLYCNITIVCSPDVIMHTLDNPYIHAWICKVTIGGRTGTAGQAWIIFSADMPNLAQSAFIWYILVVVVSTKEGTFWLKVYCILTTCLKLMFDESIS